VGNIKANRKNKLMGSRKPEPMVIGQGAYKPKAGKKTTRRPK